jgi:hypothetical protein
VKAPNSGEEGAIQSGQELVSPLTEDDRRRLVDDQRTWLAKNLETLASRP